LIVKILLEGLRGSRLNDLLEGSLELEQIRIVEKGLLTNLEIRIDERGIGRIIDVVTRLNLGRNQSDEVMIHARKNRVRIDLGTIIEEITHVVRRECQMLMGKEHLDLKRIDLNQQLRKKTNRKLLNLRLLRRLSRYIYDTV